LDFQVYLASDNSDSEDEAAKVNDRDRLRKLFGLAGGASISNKGSKGDMEITFAPALHDTGDQSVERKEDETTLEAYKRKEKERKQRKREAKNKGNDSSEEEDQAQVITEKGFNDDFFDDDDIVEAAFAAHDRASASPPPQKSIKAKKKSKAELQTDRDAEAKESAELALLMDDDSADETGGNKHFDMAEILKAEKDAKSGKKSRSARRKQAKAQNKAVVQDTFAIDIVDPRFTSLHENHQFAIDPSNPR